MLRPLLPARQCGRNAIMIAASATVRQKCHHDCCQIMTSGQYEAIITPFEGTGMKSGRFEDNAPRTVYEPAVEQSNCSKNRENAAGPDLAFGMVAEDALLPLGSVDVGVDFGGENGFVPQHLLHHAQVGTVLHKVCGKGVSEGMG